LVVFLTTAALAEETQRYVVATRRPGRLAVSSLAQDLRDPVARRVDSFRIVNGFAANLTATEVAALRRSPEVRWVEPVVERHLMVDATTPGAQMIPFGITQVQAPLAWTGRRTAEVNVVVIDSGVDFNHPDLSAAWAGGVNLLSEGQAPMDDVGHGSHVAGTIAASNNRFGVIGVVPGARLWGVKAIDSTGSGTMEDVIKGLDWVVARKAERGGNWVVNLSLGGSDTSALEREAFQHVADQGVIIVASTGNESNSGAIAPVAYPAAYPSVIAVGAVTSTNTRANFSNAGPEIDFVAPGVGVLSTIRSGFKFASFVRVDGNALPAKPMVGSKIAPLAGQYLYCGLGGPADFPPTVRGKIALIRRGEDTFANKTRRADAAGAIGVVIFNSDDSNYLFTLYPKDDLEAQKYPWGVGVGIALESGQPLADKGSGQMTIGYESDDYETKQGTSMSAPHVTGAVALLWSFAPNATPAQIVQALSATAKDLGGAGPDNVFGNGLIDVNAAARLLAPAAFVPSTRTGRPFLRRSR
jgi:subtilisin family serine protease